MPVRHSLGFVLANLRDSDATLLEVGCGAGELALALQKEGLAVTPIDVSPRAVEQARQRGLAARVADILDFTGGPYDVVLFSRSLHHMDRPGAALARAGALLGSTGLLLVEEFGFDLVDAPAAAWRYDTEALLVATASRRPPRFVESPLEQWRREHPASELATSVTLRQAVADLSPGAQEEEAPYLYRYLAAALEEIPTADHLLDLAFQWESTLIRRQQLRPIGLRWVAAAPQLEVS